VKVYAAWSCTHSSNIELRIVEQRKMNLSAHVGNVALVEEEPRGMAPAIAVLDPIRRECQHVVRSLANGA
jgi:hypothetical protein